jgi:hypothetical protein
MAEDRQDPETGPRGEPHERIDQTLEPARSHTRPRRREDEDRDREDEANPRPMSVERGDIPEALKRRYFTEDGRTATAFFTGPGAKTAAFRDHGGKLSTRDVDPNTIRDMVAIAAHRGWRTIQVRGDDDFRREVWMEARALGLDVRGYRPRQRDQQELEGRLAGRSERAVAPAPPRDRSLDGGPAPRRASTEPDRMDYDRGVRGVLLESGEAPYRRRHGQPLTPFVRLDRGDGRAVDIWGVGLSDALARSGAKTGDQVLVRRDGVDRVQKSIEVRDPRTGEMTRQAREVPRNRWTILAERFRNTTPAEAARDPELRNNQSHMAVMRTVIQTALRDPTAQARALANAREQMAARIAEGRQFGPVRIQETVHVAERAASPSSRRVDRVPEPEQGPERVRRR